MYPDNLTVTDLNVRLRKGYAWWRPLESEYQLNQLAHSVASKAVFLPGQFRAVGFRGLHVLSQDQADMSADDMTRPLDKSSSISPL